MATITVIQHSDFRDKGDRITFLATPVAVEGVGTLLRAVAQDVPDDIAREYAANPEQFIVEGLDEAAPAAAAADQADDENESEPKKRRRGH